MASSASSVSSRRATASGKGRRRLLRVVIFVILAGGFFAIFGRSSSFFDGGTAPGAGQSATLSIEAVQQAQANLADGIIEHTQYLSTGLSQTQTVPSEAPGKLGVLAEDFDTAVTSWVTVSSAWALPAAATEGIPGAEEVRAYNTALSAWRDAQLAFSDAVAGCAGALTYGQCIEKNATLYDRWKATQQKMVSSERAMVEASNKSAGIR